MDWLLLIWLPSVWAVGRALPDETSIRLALPASAQLGTLSQQSFAAPICVGAITCLHPVPGLALPNWKLPNSKLPNSKLPNWKLLGPGIAAKARAASHSAGRLRPATIAGQSWRPVFGLVAPASGFARWRPQTGRAAPRASPANPASSHAHARPEPCSKRTWPGRTPGCPGPPSVGMKNPSWSARA